MSSFASFFDVYAPKQETSTPFAPFKSGCFSSSCVWPMKLNTSLRFSGLDSFPPKHALPRELTKPVMRVCWFWGDSWEMVASAVVRDTNKFVDRFEQLLGCVKSVFMCCCSWLNILRPVTAVFWILWASALGALLAGSDVSNVASLPILLSSGTTVAKTLLFNRFWSSFTF